MVYSKLDAGKQLCYFLSLRQPLVADKPESLIFTEFEGLRLVASNFRSITVSNHG